MDRVILASASPRRRELLEQVGIDYIVVPSDVEEVTEERLPERVVLELGGYKANDVFNRYVEDVTVIGADTIVSVDGRILGKPKNMEDAFRMLKLLQGGEHQVYTGVTILNRKYLEVRKVEFVQCTEVSLYRMTNEEISAYIETGESMDKAGAYGIQGRFGAYVKGICGDYNNVVGLPIGRVYQELRKLF